jgi:sigma-B regulation protein RsbU (phosphoserine phosphatase)
MTIRTPKATIAPHTFLFSTGDLAEIIENRGDVAEEVETVRQVRERLFPAGTPAVAGLEHCGVWRAAHGVSGDYLDYLDLPRGNFGLAIGDVAGKGLPAALLMSALHGMVRALGLARRGSLKQVMRKVNQLFFRVSPDNCFASLFLARYDPGRQELSYINAGHEPPFLLRRVEAGWRIVPLEPGGQVIGVLRGDSYSELIVTLVPEDILVAYTDGGPDARNPVGEEWGSARLLQTVQDHGGCSAEEIAACVLEEADRFAGGVPQQDDMTLWVARVRRTKQRATFEAADAMLEMAEASAA